MEADIGCSSARVLKKNAVMMVRGLQLAPRPGMFAKLDLHEKDVLLIGCELTRVLDPGQRLLDWCCC